MSKIQWTDKTWNPVVGCSKCSPGCLNCYAERMANRFNRTYDTKGNLRPYYCQQGYNYDWNGLVACRPDVLDKPLHWRKPCKIFVCSMSDLFHPKVPFEFIDKVMFTIYKSYRLGHAFQILTKRPERMLEYFSGNVDARILELFRKTDERHTSEHRLTDSVNRLPRVWLGVTVCNQKEADEKRPILLRILAAVRFVSIEPMLEGIDLMLDLLLKDRPYIDWVIVGVESGPKRRQCKIEWVQSIVEQCKAANVPVFVKQINVNGKLIKMPKDFPQELPE